MPKLSVTQSVAVTNSVNTSQTVRMTDQVVGEIYLPATNAASLTFYSAPYETGPFVIAADAATNGTMTVTGERCYQLPTQLIGAGFIKLVADVATVNCVISLKS